jgi:hypothetical protein
MLKKCRENNEGATLAQVHSKRAAMETAIGPIARFFLFLVFFVFIVYLCAFTYRRQKNHTYVVQKPRRGTKNGVKYIYNK